MGPASISGSKDKALGVFVPTRVVTEPAQFHVALALVVPALVIFAVNRRPPSEIGAFGGPEYEVSLPKGLSSVLTEGALKVRLKAVQTIVVFGLLDTSF